MTLSRDQLAILKELGHVTVPSVFTSEQMDRATEEAMAYADATVPNLSEKQRESCLEISSSGCVIVRKIENPVHRHPFFTQLATKSALVPILGQLFKSAPRVVFSQIFFKAPGGSAKPMHQDNHYFRPPGQDDLYTIWIAFDHATEDSGCLTYVDRSHMEPIHSHWAPREQSYHLQVEPAYLEGRHITLAPVPRGGVSIHHGNVVHGSLANTSENWRRALTVHFSKGEQTP